MEDPARAGSPEFPIKYGEKPAIQVSLEGNIVTSSGQPCQLGMGEPVVNGGHGWT